MKKVISYVIVGIVSAIVVATIVLAFVQTSFYNPYQTGFNRLEMWVGGEKISSEYYPESSNLELSSSHFQTTDKIIDLYNKSFNQSVLMSITYPNITEVKRKTSSNSDIDDLVSASGTWLVINYQNNVKNLKIDGKNYSDNSLDEPVLVTFNKLVIQVNDTTDYDSFIIYLENTTTANLGSYSYNYYLTLRARQADLFDYIASLAD